MHFVIVTPVFEIVLQSAAYFETAITVHRDVSQIEQPAPKLIQSFASGRRRSSADKDIVGTLTEVRTFGGASTANCKLAVKFGHHSHDATDSRGEARR